MKKFDLDEQIPALDLEACVKNVNDIIKDVDKFVGLVQYCPEPVKDSIIIDSETMDIKSTRKLEFKAKVDGVDLRFGYEDLIQEYINAVESSIVDDEWSDRDCPTMPNGLYGDED